MLPFRPITAQDRAQIAPFFWDEAIPLSSYNHATLVCWQELYQQEYCILGERLLVRARNRGGSAYLWPCGRGDLRKALRALEAEAYERGEALRLIGVLPVHLPVLQAIYGRNIQVEERRDNYDYVYDINRLADLPGKKLHAKRNHIRRFRDLCPDGAFEPLSPADIPACLDLDERWYREHLERAKETEEGLAPEVIEEERASLLLERGALHTALHNFEELGMDGGIIRCHGAPLAFTLGSRISERVFDVQFERALAGYQGAFPMINQEFAIYLRARYPELTHIDREEDMGSPGLRQAKLSYGPDRLVENFCVTLGLAPSAQTEGSLSES